MIFTFFRKDDQVENKRNGTHLLCFFDIYPELQLRGGIEDKSKIFFLTFFIKTICFDPSSETSQRDGSAEWSQHMFIVHNLQKLCGIIIKYSLLSIALFIRNFKKKAETFSGSLCSL